MHKLSAVFIAFAFLVSCKGQEEKWVRYIADTAGNAIDTMNITFYENKIVLEAAGAWNWTRRDKEAHNDIFEYKILDRLDLPSDPRKTMYLLKTDNGAELNFCVYRVEKDRAAINFGQLAYNPSFKGEQARGQFDSASVVQELETMSWQSPWFYSDSLVDHLKTLRGFVSVNSDTALWYYKTRLEYVKQHKDRIARWGKPGYNYLYEEPATAAMEAKGYNPWRVYSQLLATGYYPGDSAAAKINDEYRALLETIK